MLLFFITSLSLLKSTETGFNLSTSNLPTLLFKLLKLLGANLSISNLSVVAFNLAKSGIFAKSDASTNVVLFKSDFVT